jgi:hypothetical protein
MPGMAGGVQFGSRAELNWCIIPPTSPDLVGRDGALRVLVRAVRHGVGVVEVRVDQVMT